LKEENSLKSTPSTTAPATASTTAPTTATPTPSRPLCQSECIICMNLPRSVLLLPCKHLALCNDCWHEEMKECPFCRGMIDSTMKGIFTI
jgi:hypothetical protein